SFMEIVITAILIILTLFTLAADAFYLLSLYAAARFFLEKRSESKIDYQPVSIMVPLAGADFRAYGNYARLCRQDYPTAYQIVFGVREASDSALPIVKKLIANFPNRDITLVVNSEVIGTNLKISNLRNMLARVKHEQIVIVDSDIRVQPDYLRRVVAPLSEPQVGM